MHDDAIRKLRILAPRLNQLPLVSDAEFYYDVLSGGLLWTDETPDLSGLPAGTFEGLRGVLWHRIALILGGPVKGDGAGSPEARDLFPNWSLQTQANDNEALWSEAERLFPNWPGFTLSRRSSELGERYIELKSRAMRQMDKMFDD
jgi:hypothetical protein